MLTLKCAHTRSSIQKFHLVLNVTQSICFFKNEKVNYCFLIILSTQSHLKFKKNFNLNFIKKKKKKEINSSLELNFNKLLKSTI